MVKSSKGTRAKTRGIMRRGGRERGLSPISHSLREYKEGDRVAVVIDPSIHKGQPHRRFQGLTGIVVGRQGRSFIVRVKVGDKPKTLLSRPEHLRPLS